MKFSIITPSFNQCSYLRRTMRSILGQQGAFDLEWIVMDGASTDGTVQLLRGASDPRIIWQSQKDAGQSDALNKGLHLATGDIIGWLNSDDLYTSDALSTVAGALLAHPSAQWVVGRCGIIDQDDRPIRPSITRYKNRLLDRYSRRRLLGGENPISQPAVFWRRSFGQAVGGLDASLHHAMDYDLWLRMSRQADPLILPHDLALFRIHPSSKSGTQTAQRFAEQYAVARRYFDGDSLVHLCHWFNVQKIIWGYRFIACAEKMKWGSSSAPANLEN